MGIIITTKPSVIIPSQDFLKEDTIKFIFKCITEGTEDRLPPTPIVRKIPSTENYVAIDGHNLLAVYDLLGKDCQVYVAQSADDALSIGNLDLASSKAIQQRNKDLAEKFDKVIEDMKKLESEGIKSFSDLRNKCPYI